MYVFIFFMIALVVFLYSSLHLRDSQLWIHVIEMCQLLYRFFVLACRKKRQNGGRLCSGKFLSQHFPNFRDIWICNLSKGVVITKQFTMQLVSQFCTKECQGLTKRTRLASALRQDKPRQQLPSQFFGCRKRCRKQNSIPLFATDCATDFIDFFFSVSSVILILH